MLLPTGQLADLLLADGMLPQATAAPAGDASPSATSVTVAGDCILPALAPGAQAVLPMQPHAALQQGRVQPQHAFPPPQHAFPPPQLRPAAVQPGMQAPPAPPPFAACPLGAAPAGAELEAAELEALLLGLEPQLGQEEVRLSLKVGGAGGWAVGRVAGSAVSATV